MFTWAFDKEHAVVVGYFSGTDDTTEDYRENARAILHLDEECRDHPQGTAMIVCTSPESPRPNANRRRIIADANKKIQAPKTLTAMVTPSAWMRGVVSVVLWIGAIPNQEVTTHATFEEAASWIEEKRGQKLPILARLFEEAKKKQRRRNTGP